jgi:3-phenylpropionate/cinnamic acid dioxygenase small subunit
MLTTAKTSTSQLTRGEAEDFLFQQAEYIDSRNYAPWIDLFSPEGAYWIPARPGDTDPRTQLSYMYDEVPSMVARCERLLDFGTAGQQPITRSSHIVGNVRLGDTTTDGELVVYSRFQVTQFRRDVVTSYAGAYTHHLVATPDGMKIRRQRVDLIDCDGIHDYILQVYI